MIRFRKSAEVEHQFRHDGLAQGVQSIRTMIGSQVCVDKAERGSAQRAMTAGGVSIIGMGMLVDK
jgi:hypothetical protein